MTVRARSAERAERIIEKGDWELEDEVEIDMRSYEIVDIWPKSNSVDSKTLSPPNAPRVEKSIS